MSEDQAVRCKIKEYIQPFEQSLARLELTALGGDFEATSDPTVLSCLAPRAGSQHLAERLAYFETVQNGTGVAYYTTQALREGRSLVARNGVQPAELRRLLSSSASLPVAKRRILRYGPHGVHEYRGKYFPQLVRALLNIASVKSGDLVLDPMCGSGTTLVEACLLGCQVVGADLNPLSVAMSDAKCGTLWLTPEVLLAEYEQLMTALKAPSKRRAKRTWISRLPEQDQMYLARWFEADVLASLDSIAIQIQKVNDKRARSLFWISFSNILRAVSWQDDDDLRIRRRKKMPQVDACALLFDELRRNVNSVLAFVFGETRPKASYQVIEADARHLTAHSIPQGLKGQVRCVVTSPPYATALPYLDTDRLSLSYLGLLNRSEHRRRDYEMIGNREIAEQHRLRYWKEYQQLRSHWPASLVSLIDRIATLNQASPVGFRRRNLSALLSRYFRDMELVFGQILQLLAPGCPAFVIIGNNHTIAGTERVDILTDRLLGALGQQAGLELDGTIAMEMLTSRDIHKQNAIGSETILMFRKPT